MTDGNVLGVASKQIKPAMDWYVAQLKYYSNLDPFPFVIDKNGKINEIIKDLSNSYKFILLLDDIKTKLEVPEDTLVLRHQDVVNFAKCEITDAKATS